RGDPRGDRERQDQDEERRRGGVGSLGDREEGEPTRDEPRGARRADPLGGGAVHPVRRERGEPRLPDPRRRQRRGPDGGPARRREEGPDRRLRAGDPRGGPGPVAIDVAAFAVENAFEANYDDARGQTVALVNVGAQVVNINIVSNGVPCFTRDITTAGNQYTEEIQRALSISFSEAERIKLGGRRTDTQDVVPQEVEQAVQSVTETVIGEISRSLDF